jgi:putative aldouronate transport system permease protein
MSGGEGGDKAAIAESIRYATIMVATVPVLVIYPFVQKYFVKGAMVGAVKG